MSVTRERTRVAVWEFEEQVLRQSAASASEMFKFHILYSYKIRQLTTSSYKFTFQTFHFQFSDTWRTWVAWDKYLASESERTSEHFMLEYSSNLEKGESVENLSRITLEWWLFRNWLSFKKRLGTWWYSDRVNEELKEGSRERCFSILSSASLYFLQCPC